jgi:23S rRNA-/tRNA-specific pseudouridylate synthase
MRKTTRWWSASHPGSWYDRLERDEFTTRIAAAPAGTESRPTCRRMACDRSASLGENTLETGRHHQNRVQFAHRGGPILGERCRAADRRLREQGP